MKVYPLLSLLLLFGLGVSGTAPVYAATKPAMTEHVISVVNLNEASASALTSLKGIGKKTAEAIVAYRSEKGKLKSAEDLLSVKNFTQKRVDRLLKDNPGRIKY